MSNLQQIKERINELTGDEDVKKEDLSYDVAKLVKNLEGLSGQADETVEEFFKDSGVKFKADSNEQLEQDLEDLINKLVGVSGTIYNTYFGAISELDFIIEKLVDDIDPENADRLKELKRF